MDPIFKRILDALKGIVYQDDGQIRQCLATKIELAKPYTLSNRHIPDDLYRRLVVLLDSSEGDILFIEVGQVTSQEVVFGEIDRSAR